jgi:hypothetical protein
MRMVCAFSRGILERFQVRAETWKDKYKGERCFCIGNGPSLKDTPLHLLNNEYTFGLNRIAKIYPLTTWRPSFYVNVTVAVIDDGWAESAKEAMKNTPSFVAYANLPHLIGAEGSHIRVPGHVFPISVSKDSQLRPDTWSHNIADRVSKTGSSMLAVMQIAAYMGFDPIILVGCDAKWASFDYEEDIDPNHFVEDYWGKMSLDGKEIPVTPEQAKRYTDDAIACHLCAKTACDKIGVKIYNATIGGDLEVYPRVDFMEIVND